MPPVALLSRTCAIQRCRARTGRTVLSQTPRIAPSRRRLARHASTLRLQLCHPCWQHARYPTMRRPAPGSPRAGRSELCHSGDSSRRPRRSPQRLQARQTQDAYGRTSVCVWPCPPAIPGLVIPMNAFSSSWPDGPCVPGDIIAGLGVLRQAQDDGLGVGEGTGVWKK